MRIPIFAVIVTTVLGAVAGAQEKTTSTLFTRPSVPSTEALDRLSLKLAWYKLVPMDGLKDGIATIQFLPGEGGDEILIQTRSGLVQLMDAENGDLKWRLPVGLPYRQLQGAAFNSHSVYVTRDDFFFALNRKTGKHRLFTVDQRTGTATLGFSLFNAPSTNLIADEAAVFIPSDNRVTAYLMPKATQLQVNLPPPSPGPFTPLKDIESSPQPKFQGTFILLGGSITRPMIMAGEAVGILTDDGNFVSFNKYSLEEKFHYKTFGPALTGAGHFGNMAYVGSTDFNVYALNTLSSKLRWRFLSGSPIIRTPVATDADVFVVSSLAGMHRLHRDEGKLVWKNAKANLFLATNNKFVYALDAQRHLLVLDYHKGTTLSRFDLGDWVVPFTNTLTDRIYLANHDGKVICLRHQKFQKAFRPTSAAGGADVAEPVDMKEAKIIPNAKDD